MTKDIFFVFFSTIETIYLLMFCICSIVRFTYLPDFINSFWAIYQITHNTELLSICCCCCFTVVNLFVVASYFFRPGRSKNRTATAVFWKATVTVNRKLLSICCRCCCCFVVVVVVVVFTVVNVFVVAPYFFRPGRRKNGTVTAGFVGFYFLRKKKNRHSKLVWLRFLYHSTDQKAE